MLSIIKSFRFIDQSFDFLLANKRITIFPIISLIALAIYLTAVISGFVGLLGADVATRASTHPILIVLLVIITYFICPFIAIYCNCAMTGFIIQKLKGKPVTVGEGFRMANRRLLTIIGWTLVSTTVGAVLHAMENSHNILAEIAAVFVGIAWSIASYFVVPMIVMTDIKLFPAIKQSVKLFGRNFRRNIGIVFVFFLVGAVILGATYFLTTLLSNKLLAWGLAIAVLVFFYFIFYCLGSIIRAALYLYNVEKIETNIFDKDLLETAFVEKKFRLGRR